MVIDYFNNLPSY